VEGVVLCEDALSRLVGGNARGVARLVEDGVDDVFVPGLGPLELEYVRACKVPAPEASTC
jgi:hypothetical protein